MIRIAGYADYALMAKIHGASFERGWKPREIEELLAKPGAKGFLYEVADNPAGFSIIRIAGDECEIITIAVDATYKRRGIGGELVQHIKDYAKREKVKTLFLEVAEDNFTATALYERAGFERHGVRKGYYRRWHGRRIDALMMRFVLE